MSEQERVGVAFYCVDPRLHHCVTEYEHNIAEKMNAGKIYGFRYPGPDKVISRGSKHQQGAAREQLELIVELASPDVVAIIGHSNCAGNQVSDEEHRKDIRNAVQSVRDWGFEGKIMGFFQNRKSDTSWPLEEIARL